MVSCEDRSHPLLPSSFELTGCNFEFQYLSTYVLKKLSFLRYETVSLCTIEHDTNGLSFTLFSYSFSCPLISDNERNFGFFYFTNSIYQRTTLILKKVSVADDVINNF